MKKIFAFIFMSLIFVQCNKPDEKVEPKAREDIYIRFVNVAQSLPVFDIYQYYYNVVSKIADSVYFSMSIPEYQYLKSQMPDSPDENGNPVFRYYLVPNPSQDTINYIMKIETPKYSPGKYHSLFIYDKDKTLLVEDDVSFSADSVIKVRLINFDPNATQTVTITNSSVSQNLSAGYLQTSNSVEIPAGQYTVTVGNTALTLNSKANKFIQVVVTPAKSFIIY